MGPPQGGEVVEVVREIRQVPEAAVFLVNFGVRQFAILEFPQKGVDVPADQARPQREVALLSVFGKELGRLPEEDEAAPFFTIVV